jgi:hypothetical protein
LKRYESASRPHSPKTLLTVVFGTIFGFLAGAERKASRIDTLMGTSTPFLWRTK